jgi:uncharacterized protein (DUF2147 family)
MPHLSACRKMSMTSAANRERLFASQNRMALQGKIEKVFPTSSEDRNPKCEKCEGALKNAPVIGLPILSGLKKEGAEYTGGRILDPDNGKVYSSKIQLTNGGKKLNVRGYIGVSMLGRSQTWERPE